MGFRVVAFFILCAHIILTLLVAHNTLVHLGMLIYINLQLYRGIAIQVIFFSCTVCVDHLLVRWPFLTNS